MSKNNAAQFVVCEARERIEIGKSKRKLIEKVSLFKGLHKCDFVNAQVEGEHIWFNFSKRPGYSLGLCAKDRFGEQGRFLWVDQYQDTDKFVIVCGDADSITYEGIVNKDEFDAFLLPVIFEETNTPAIFFSSQIPDFIEGYIDATPELAAVDAIVYHRLDECIIDNLKIKKEYQFKSVDSFDFKYTESTKKISPVIAIPLLIGALFLIYTFLSEDQVEQIIPIDPYESFKAELKKTRATAILNETYKAIRVIEQQNKWNLSGCELKEGTPLVCELIPSLSAKDEDLKKIQTAIGNNAQTILKNNVAHVVININVPEPNNYYLITPLQEVRARVYNNVSKIATSGSTNVLDQVIDNNWASQVFEFSRENTQLSNILKVAEAVNGLPVNFVSLSIKKADMKFSIQYSIKAFGDI